MPIPEDEVLDDFIYRTFLKQKPYENIKQICGCPVRDELGGHRGRYERK